MAGAADELDAAVQVNPYDVDSVSKNLALALRMPLDERIDRWRRMMSVLRTHNIHTWQATFLRDLQAAAS
jgi:trehalose 6-phosphate synthase